MIEDEVVAKTIASINARPIKILSLHAFWEFGFGARSSYFCHRYAAGVGGLAHGVLFASSGIGVHRGRHDGAAVFMGNGLARTETYKGSTFLLWHGRSFG